MNSDVSTQVMTLQEATTIILISAPPAVRASSASYGITVSPQVPEAMVFSTEAHFPGITLFSIRL